LFADVSRWQLAFYCDDEVCRIAECFHLTRKWAQLEAQDSFGKSCRRNSPKSVEKVRCDDCYAVRSNRDLIGTNPWHSYVRTNVRESWRRLAVVSPHRVSRNRLRWDRHRDWARCCRSSVDSFDQATSCTCYYYWWDSYSAAHIFAAWMIVLA